MTEQAENVSEDRNYTTRKFADNETKSGNCGDNLTWDLSEDGTLTISGTGAMYDYWNDSYVFGKLSNLKKVIIGDSVTSIGQKAFSGCTSLSSVTIPDSVKGIGSNAFDNTKLYNDESNWQDNVLYVGKHLIKARNVISKNYNIKEGTLCISGRAFFQCKSLTSVTIPESVTSIGNSAFLNCTNLVSVPIPDSVKDIGEGALGYKHYDNNEKVSYFTIIGIEDSAAKVYAKENGFAFIVSSEADKLAVVEGGKGVIKDGLLCGIAEKTKVSNVSAMFTGIIEIKDKDGKVCPGNSVIGTGMVINLLKNGKAIDSVTVVIKGDIDGNGNISTIDYMNIKHMFLKKSTLEGVYYKAADTDEDGRISTTDFLLIRRHFIKQSNLFE